MGNGVLAVSFYGPFVFDFDSKKPGEENVVNIYAPQCVGHFASVHSDKVEAGLALNLPPEAYSYRLKPRAAWQAGPTSVYKLDEILCVDSARRKAANPTPAECQFILSVPRPDQVIGLAVYGVKIMHYDLPDPGKNKRQKCATSMRFIYSDLEEGEVWELLDESKAKSESVLKTIDPIPPSNTTQLNFRYHLGTPELAHKDAEQCFREMRNLFPPLGAWKIEFEESTPGRVPPRQARHQVNDCHAPQILFASTAQLENWKNAPEANHNGTGQQEKGDGDRGRGSRKKVTTKKGR